MRRLDSGYQAAYKSRWPERRRATWRNARRKQRSRYVQINCAKDWSEFPETAKCNTCGEVKSRDEFGRENRRRLGLTASCKECRNKSEKRRYVANCEERRRKANLRTQKLKARDPKRFNAIRAASRRKWLANSPQAKLACTLRARLHDALAGRPSPISAVRDLGCSMPIFIFWLENQFEDGMHWGNYGNGRGKWSLDHIKPLASFDLSNPEEVRKACHFGNLQPM